MMDRPAALWIELLMGPVVWFIALLLNFAIAPWVCQFHWQAVPYFVIAIAILISAAAGWLSLQRWRRAGIEAPEGSSAKNLSMASMVLNCSFIVFLIAQMIPNPLLSGCS
jgi:hypothetical protein